MLDIIDGRSQLKQVLTLIVERTYVDAVDAVFAQDAMKFVLEEILKIRGQKCKVKTKVYQVDGGLFKIHYNVK